MEDIKYVGEALVENSFLSVMKIELYNWSLTFVGCPKNKLFNYAKLINQSNVIKLTYTIMKITSC